ncbi:multicopper oxidase family protein [Paenibacillus chartarius]|uniref:Multicopper oxidase family protein n=1 Tax=Paenibacillus chartarius TaxID=747481 RepID=A0ABV6DLD2_9BACL
MYSLWSGLELPALALQFILAWIAASKATRIVYGGSTGVIRRRLAKQWGWSFLLLLPAAGAAACMWMLMSAYPPALWEERLYLEAPLLLLPLAAVWLLSVPSLIGAGVAARSAAKLEAKESAPDMDAFTSVAASEAPSAAASAELKLLRRAASPWLTLPYAASALGAAAALYFRIVPPASLSWQELAIPLAAVLVALTALWMSQRSRAAAVERTGAAVRGPLWKRAVSGAAILAAVAASAAYPIYAAYQSSLLPGELNMMAGPVDDGIPGTAVIGANNLAAGTVQAGHLHSMTGASLAAAAAAPAVYAAEPRARQLTVDQLTGPQTGDPDRSFELTARRAVVTLSSGKQVDAWTFNGELPGPELRMKKGELIEVTLRNEDIDAGVTLHWHGLDVPNAEDGVAGVTQNAVMPGETHTYRFRAMQAGTFWYHSHQVSSEAVRKGLFGALIVEPETADIPVTNGTAGTTGTVETSGTIPASAPAQPAMDIPVVTHVWDGAGLAIGSSDTLQRSSIPAGTKVRLRLLNTDDWARRTYALIGVPFQVAAIDGTDLHEPSILQNTRLELTTGGRYDVTFTMPDRPVFLSIGDSSDSGLLMSPDGQGNPPPIPALATFDPLHYGTPQAAPFGADSRFDREFTMVLDQKLGFYNGNFDLLYTMNGAVFPKTPSFLVREGDLVKVTIVNRSFFDHPMHLHGHHVLVLSRNGVPADGSPWWSDTLDVTPGDTFELAFRADNPGIWMDHCHNLQHAAAGMSMHLMYDGVTTPYSVGSATTNHPE